MMRFFFEDRKDLEEKKSEEALLMVQKKFGLWRYQNERDEARRLQSSGSSKRMRKGMDLQHPFSSELCRSLTVDPDGEMTLEFPRRSMEAGARRRNGDAGDRSRCGKNTEVKVTCQEKKAKKLKARREK